MLFAIDMLGTLAFAITGAYKGIRYNLDWLGILIMSIVTGVGGGIVRDVLLGETPPVALRSPTYIVVCAVACAAMIGAKKALTASWAFVLVADALGLGFFTAVGASKAAALDAGPVAVIFMAAITAAGGGLIRDVLVREIPQILKSDFYATAAILGGILFVVLPYVGVPHMEARIVVTTAFTFLLRLIAMRKKMHLPHTRK